MTRISIPKQRSYFLASPNEPEYLMCWIPPEEYGRMVQNGQIPQEVVGDYPLGIEVEVSEEDFREYQLDLGVTPEAIKQAYLQALEDGTVQPGETVLAANLESWAREAEESTARGLLDETAKSFGPPGPRELGEPEMTEGEDAMTILSDLW
ncbi:MAG: hypothetical protein AMJ93_05475 [Anaerolineae bacterium SM23_84]|nr:MAG: hypothetical protein AMJ93_05475 [Anaerolineae bacterium SM23_84]